MRPGRPGRGARVSLIQEALEKAGRSVKEPAVLAPDPGPADPQEFKKPFQVSKSTVLLAGAFIFLAAFILFQSVRPRSFPGTPAFAAPGIFNPQKWSLSGITVSGDERFALINNEVVGVGDRLPGNAVVRQIGSRIVILESQGKKIKLSL